MYRDGSHVTASYIKLLTPLLTAALTAMLTQLTRDGGANDVEILAPPLHLPRSPSVPVSGYSIFEFHS